MLKKHFHVLGVMSGTSLDGIDLAEVFFTRNDRGWSYEFGVCETLSYPSHWKQKLATAIVLSAAELEVLDTEYTAYLARQIDQFISKDKLTDLDAIASHGHTVIHRPDEGYTKQIGNRPEIAQMLNQTVVCDFRVQDVELAGEGAPLVPIGDRLLFGDFDYCINLGGFANISYEQHSERIAYDLCPVNICLNPLAERLGRPFDKGGNLARSGKVIPGFLEQLNKLLYYHMDYPKSLGLEWVRAKIDPLMAQYDNKPEDLLNTFTAHIAQQIAKPIAEGSRVLFTGGGAYNTYLMECIRAQKELAVVAASTVLIEFKEALIFALLGVLRLRNEVNVLSSVTGALNDHSSGVIFNP